MTAQYQQAHLGPKSMFLEPFSNKRFLGEIAVSKTGEGKTQGASITWSVRMLESAKNKLTNIKVCTIMGMHQRNTGTDGKNSQGPNLEQLDQENKVVLDF